MTGKMKPIYIILTYLIVITQLALPLKPVAAYYSSRLKETAPFDFSVLPEGYVPPESISMQNHESVPQAQTELISVLESDSIELATETEVESVPQTVVVESISVLESEPMNRAAETLAESVSEDVLMAPLANPSPNYSTEIVSSTEDVHYINNIRYTSDMYYSNFEEYESAVVGFGRVFDGTSRVELIYTNFYRATVPDLNTNFYVDVSSDGSTWHQVIHRTKNLLKQPWSWPPQGTVEGASFSEEYTGEIRYVRIRTKGVRISIDSVSITPFCDTTYTSGDIVDAQNVCDPDNAVDPINETVLAENTSAAEMQDDSCLVVDLGVDAAAGSTVRMRYAWLEEDNPDNRIIDISISDQELNCDSENWQTYHDASINSSDYSQEYTWWPSSPAPATNTFRWVRVKSDKPILLDGIQVYSPCSSSFIEGFGIIDAENVCNPMSALGQPHEEILTNPSMADPAKFRPTSDEVSCLVIDLERTYEAGSKIDLLMAEWEWLGPSMSYIEIETTNLKGGCSSTGLWDEYYRWTTTGIPTGEDYFWLNEYAGTPDTVSAAEPFRYIRIKAQSEFDLDAIQLYGPFDLEPPPPLPDSDCEDTCDENIDANAPHQDQRRVHEPINARNGVYTYGVDDLTVQGNGQPLTFRRFYISEPFQFSYKPLNTGTPLDSLIAVVSNVGPFHTWSHNYNARIFNLEMRYGWWDEYGNPTLVLRKDWFYADSAGGIHRINVDHPLAPTEYELEEGFGATLENVTEQPTGCYPDNPEMLCPPVDLKMVLRNQTIYYFQHISSAAYVGETYALSIIAQPSELPGNAVLQPVVLEYADSNSPFPGRLTAIRSGSASIGIDYITLDDGDPETDADPIVIDRIYDHSDREVSYNYGEVVGVNYQQLVRATDVQGNDWTYDYVKTRNVPVPDDFNAPLPPPLFSHKLAAVINPEGETAERQRFYCEVAADGTYVTDALPPGGEEVCEDSEAALHFNGRVIAQYNGENELAGEFNYVSDTEVNLTDGRGYTTTYYHDEQGRAIRTEVDGDPIESDIEYDEYYRPTSQTDANGVVTTMIWSNALWRPGGEQLTSVVRDPSGINATTNYTYGDYNNLLSATDPKGYIAGNLPEDYTTSYSYTDARFPSLPTSISDPINGVDAIQMTYTAEGYLSTVTNAQGIKTCYAYNADGQRIRMISNSQNEQTNGCSLDVAGEELIAEFKYDQIGRLIETIDAQGYRNVIEYDLHGNVTLIVENFSDGTQPPVPPGFSAIGGGGYGHVCVFNEFASTTENICTQMTYDTANRLTQTKGTQGHITVFTYDEAGRLISETANQVGGGVGSDQNVTTSFAYDTVGNVITVTDPLLKIHYTCYDAQNRPVRVVQFATDDHITSCAADYIPTTHGNNDANLVTDIEYDGNGNVISVSTQIEPSTTRTDRTCYDALNRPVRQVANVVYSGSVCSASHQDLFNAGTSSSNLTTDYVYDANSNLIQTTDPAGIVTQYSYDALNRVTSVAYNYDDGIHDFAGGEAADQDVIVNYYYNPNGTVQATADPVGLVTWMCYDPLGRTTRTITNYNGVDGAWLAAQTPQVLAQHADGICGQPAASFNNGTNNDYNLITEYAYDSLSRVTDITNPGGQVTHIGYDGLGREATIIENFVSGGSVTNAQNVSTSLGYDALSNLVQVIDPLNTVTGYQYDSLNRQTDAIYNYADGTFDPAYPEIDITENLTYDRLGRVISQTDPNNNPTTFTYDGFNRLFQIVDALGNPPTQYQYDLIGNLLTVTDPLGQVTSFSYDGLNRQTSMITPEGHSTLVEYDRLGQVTAQVDANGIRTEWAYDALGRVTQVRENVVAPYSPNNPTYPDQNVQTDYVYDIKGNLLQVLLPSGESITYTYDAMNRTIVSDGIGSLETWVTSYDVLGRPQMVAAPSGVITTFGYDGMNQLTSVDYSDDTPDVTYVYDALGRRTDMIDGTGTTLYGYDALSRVTSITDPLNQTVGYDYDPAGRRTKLTLPDSKEVNYAYDSINRLTGVTDWDNNSVNYAYDQSSRLIGMHLPSNLTASYAYDQDSRLTGMSYDQTGQPTARYDYTLDPVGNRLSVTEQLWGTAPDPVPGLALIPESEFKTTLMTAVGDEASLLWADIDFVDENAGTADASSWRVQVIADSTTVAGSTSPWGASKPGWCSVAAEQCAELVIHLDTVDADGTDESVLFTYDRDASTVPYTTGGTSAYESLVADTIYPLLLEVLEELIIVRFGTEFEVDAIRVLNTALEVNARTPGTPDASWVPDALREITYSYDDVYRLTGAHVEDFYAVLPDPLGRPPPPEQAEPIPTENWTVTVADGTDGDALAITLGFESLGAPIESAPNLYVFRWPGSDTSETEAAAAASALESSPMVISYVQQFLPWMYPRNADGGVPLPSYAQDYSYRYDLMGNRIYVTEGSEATWYTYNSANQIVSAQAGELVSGRFSATGSPQDFTYDANGNLTSDGVNDYSYDAANRLTRIVDGETLLTHTYAYDGDGNRRQQTVNGVATDYLLDPVGGLTQVLGEVTEGDSTWYLLGLDMIGQESEDTWSYFGYDGLGSMRFLTDSTGTMTYSTDYSPYGELIADAGTGASSLGFTGEHTDKSGLTYLRARYLNTATGTFMSTDPVMGMVGSRAMQWNPYLYVAGNPVNYLDPSGLFLGDLLGKAKDAVSDVFDAVGDAVGDAYDAVKDFIKCTNWSEVLKAVIAGVVAVAAFAAIMSGVGLIVGGGLLGTAISVFIAGALSGQVFRGMENILHGENVFTGLGNLGDMLLDGAIALVTFGLFKGISKGFNSLGRFKWFQRFRAWDAQKTQSIVNRIGNGLRRLGDTRLAQSARAMGQKVRALNARATQSIANRLKDTLGVVGRGVQRIPGVRGGLRALRGYPPRDNPLINRIRGGIFDFELELRGRFGRLENYIRTHGTRVTRSTGYSSTSTPNSIQYRMDTSGRMTNYIVYNRQGIPYKRVDLIGPAHGGVPTPHAIYFEAQTIPRGPRAGQVQIVSQSSKTLPRVTESWEVP